MSLILPTSGSLYGALRKAAPACLASVLLLALSAGSALAAGGSVRYSYEKVDVAGAQQWVLVPHAELKLAVGKKGPSKGDVIGAFNLLKQKKKTSYGDAKISIGRGKWPQKAEISVAVDPKFAAYAPIVMAEVVYTLTEMGIEGVNFPGYSTGNLGREDIPFAVYTLTVPMWQALPPGELSAAQVVMSDGTTLHVSELYSRWKSKDKALYKDLYAFLKSENISNAIFVLRTLPTLKIPYVDEVLPLLAHENATVRKEALAALESEMNEKKVLTAVAKQLDAEKDEPTALAMAAFLGKAKDDSYAVLEPLWIIEKAGDEKLAVKAASDIVKFKKDGRVVPALYAQLLGKRKTVAAASVKSIAAIDDDATQIKALGEEKIPAALRKEIAQDLTEDKDASSQIAGYVYLANNTGERESKRALDSLGQMKGDDARKSLEAMLEDKTDWRRQYAATILAKQAKLESIPAFAKAIKSFEDDASLEKAGYAVMLDQSLKTIQEQTKSKNNVVQRLAYLALGERSKKEKAGKSVFETLKAGTSNKDPLIRGASARALGAFANKEAADVLATLKADKSAAVRRDVAIALGEFKNGELIEVLMGYIDDSSPEVVAASIDSLGLRAEGSAWDPIRSEVNSKHPEVRANALRALSRLVNRQDKVAVTEMVGMLSGAVSDKNVMIRKRAIEQLGTFQDESAVLAISSQLGGDDISVRETALDAIARTKHPSAVELITDSLDDPNVDIRYAATEALATLGNSAAKPKLEAQITKESNDELKKFMEQTAKKL